MDDPEALQIRLGDPEAVQVGPHQAEGGIIFEGPRGEPCSQF